MTMKFRFLRSTLALCLVLVLFTFSACSFVKPVAPPESEPQPSASSVSIAKSLAPSLPASESSNDFIPVTKDDEALLENSWLHIYTKDNSTLAFQYRFAQQERALMFSNGLYQSGAGVFLFGNYEFVEDGLLFATFGEAGIGESETIQVQATATFSASWVSAEKDALMITLVEFDSGSEASLASFEEIVNQPMLYTLEG